MNEADIPGLQSTALWAAFAVACLLGALLARTRFCTMGALSDLFNIGDWTRMRMWLCAIGVALIGTQALALAGVIDPGKSIYTVPRLTWLSDLAGGLMFGFGMVLASGCGGKTLVRIGTGSLKALVVLVVMGITAYMTLKGVFGVYRAGVLDAVAIDLTHGQDLPRLLGGTDKDAVATARWVLGPGLGLLLIGFALLGRDFRSADNVLGSLGVGAAIVAVWYVSGHLGYLAEDPNTLDERFLATNSGRMESLSFVGPVAYLLELLMLWSDTSRVATIGIVTVPGVIAGALAWALITRQFRWEGFRNTEDTADHLVGASLMGIGGVTAMGCTFGQGLSGLSTLSVGSMIAFAAIVAGAAAGFRFQAWRIERTS